MKKITCNYIECIHCSGKSGDKPNCPVSDNMSDIFEVERTNALFPTCPLYRES